MYLRISDDRTGEQLGVARQREDCEKLCADKGWTPVEYMDNDVSASTGKRRPEYEHMLDDIRAGRIGGVVCWDLDRLHRRPIELESFMALADEKRLALASVSGEIDLSDPQGRLVARLKGAVAAHETEHKKARQRRAAKQKAQSGRPQWKYAFGYRDGKPDPEIAPLVAQIYRLMASGGSHKDACKVLNDAGAYRELVRRPKQCSCETACSCERGVEIEYREWAEPSMSAFLRKPRNAGLRSHTDTETGVTEIVGKGTWEPLVDEALWRSVQDILQRNAAGRRPYRKHLLSGGVLGCGGCGYHLSGQQTGTGQLKYHCTKCFGISVIGEETDKLVLKMIGGRLAKTDAADLLRADEHDTAEAEANRQKITTLNSRLAELGVERAQGLLSAVQVKAASDEIERQLAGIETERRDRDKARIFDGIRVGTPEAVEDIRKLTPDRLRAVIGVLADITVLPIGKGKGSTRKGQFGRVFEPDRVRFTWDR